MLDGLFYIILGAVALTAILTVCALVADHMSDKVFEKLKRVFKI